MRLADRVAQCKEPFVVQHSVTQQQTRLTGANDFANAIAQCPTRYILTDNLTRLCASLAYSKGAQSLACADLLHIPAERVWVEWCDAPWVTTLRQFGFTQPGQDAIGFGRRGALLMSSKSGRRGLIRTFWTVGDTDMDVLTSSMETYFDLDAEAGEEPEAPDGIAGSTLRVTDQPGVDADILDRCFRFRYERTWDDYYAHAGLDAVQREALARHALGTIAIDIPLLLSFFLLLSTRSGLPQRTPSLDRLNHARLKAGHSPLLDHIEVLSPIPSYYALSSADAPGTGRRGPRLHHVRGHLVRRGRQLFWRVPHLRGTARHGTVRTRTVTWTFDQSASRQSQSRAGLHS